jgi:hypothetical protein
MTRLCTERLDSWTTDLLVPNRLDKFTNSWLGVTYKIRSTVELANLANRKAERSKRPNPST